MATININIQIKDENKDLVVAAMLDKYPKPENFTDEGWLKEIFRREVKRTVQDYAERTAINSVQGQVDNLIKDAKDSVIVPDDITE